MRPLLSAPMLDILLHLFFSLQTTAQTMKQQLEAHMKASQTLRANISMLESKVAEAISKKETLKARALSAQVCPSSCCFSIDLSGVLQHPEGTLASMSAGV